MPTVLSNEHNAAVNRGHFEALVHSLLQDRSVRSDSTRRSAVIDCVVLDYNGQIAIVRWNIPDRLSGAGIVLFPTMTSTASLAGAVFVNTNFPDFIMSIPTTQTPSPSRIQPLAGSLLRGYQPAPLLLNIASSSRQSGSGNDRSPAQFQE